MLTGPILIAGAGAVGSVIGGMLRAAGHQVALLGRSNHLDAIARRGLIIDGRFGHREVHGLELVHDSGRLRGREFGLIVIAVKSYDTEQMAIHVRGLLGDDGSRSPRKTAWATLRLSPRIWGRSGSCRRA